MADVVDSDIELEIEGDDPLTGNKTLLRDLRDKSNQLVQAQPVTSDEIDQKYSDWEPQLPYSCKLTLEDLGMSDERQIIKTYTIQIMKSKDSIYGLFCRWTSGGDKQDYSFTTTESFDEAVNFFKERFFEKTFNSWDQRDTFKIKAGAYRWLGNFKELKGGAPMDVELNPEKAMLKDKVRFMMMRAVSTPTSLPRDLHQTLLLLFNLGDSETILDGYFVNKNKLGLFDIELRNMLRAFKILSDLELQILSSSRRNQKIFELSTDFANLLPQSYKIVQNPMIDDQAKLKKAYTMVQTITGIYHQMALIKSVAQVEGLSNPVEDLYSALGAQLKPIPQNDSLIYSVIAKMLTAHGMSHSDMKITMKDLFEIHREGQFQAFYPFRAIKRRMLWVGAPTPKILEYLLKGFTILKTDSPTTTGFFGKAIYSTDVASKAARHIGIDSSSSNREGFLLLCEVATGIEYLTDKPLTVLKPPDKHHSIKGQGKFDCTDYVDLNGARGSVGVPQKVPRYEDSAFMFNEFAVFDEGQIRPCFLVKIEFN